MSTSSNRNNSVVPNTYGNNRNSGVQGRANNRLNARYLTPRGNNQVPANPNNTANSHFNVTHRRLLRLMTEYHNYLAELYRRYGRPNLIPNANRQAIYNRVLNYERRIREANQAFGNAAAF